MAISVLKQYFIMQCCVHFSGPKTFMHEINGFHLLAHFVLSNCYISLVYGHLVAKYIFMNPKSEMS